MEGNSSISNNMEEEKKEKSKESIHYSMDCDSIRISKSTFLFNKIIHITAIQ